MKTATMIVGSMLLSTAPALAAAPATEDATVGDPNQRVCRMIGEIGTRLGGHRVCMTRAEWAEQRRETREGVGRAQTRQFNLRIDERVMMEAPR